MTHRSWLAVAMALALPTTGWAQSDSARPAAGLFDATAPLAFTLTTNLQALLKDRGKDRKYHGAVLSYIEPGAASGSLDIRVRTRGHFRLNPNICQLPPLLLDLPKQAAASTPFGARGKLKLATHCRNRDLYEQYTVGEYLIYRAYNLLTERSFRVRLALVTYADSAGRDAPVTRHGFLIEDDREMAARNPATILEKHGLLQDDIEPYNMGLVAVFQYMIGNTDWSVWGPHNIELLQDSAAIYAVPYDFDWSGVIDAVYAKPDSRLPIQSVRQRLNRGTCRTPEELAPLFAEFQAKQEAIYALYQREPALSPKTREAALRYYDEFYETIGDPRAIKRAFLQGCGNRT